MIGLAVVLSSLAVAAVAVLAIVGAGPALEFLLVCIALIAMLAYGAMSRR